MKLTKRRIAVDLAEIAAVYAAACAALSTGCISSRLMFYPPEPSYSWDSPDVIRLGADASAFAALWLENPGAEKVLVCFHGNAEDIGHGMAEYRAFRDFGLSVLCVEYPGYGPSDGRATEKGVYAGADAAYEFLTGDKKMAASNIVIMGKSIGSGPACYLAEKHPDVGGLIIQSGFTSAFRAVTQVRILPSDPFPNLARIDGIKCRILFLHGTADRTVPYSHARKMFAKAGGDKKLIPVEGAGHNDLEASMGRRDYLAAIRAFAIP
jgi:hypothetical protein